MTETKSLGRELPREIARVRDEVLPLYVEIGTAGQFAVILMRRAMDAASKAMIEGDIIAMMRAYEDLRGFKT